MDAEFSLRDRTTVTREVVVKLPLDWKNFGYIVAQVGKFLKEAGRAQYDDACTIESRDDGYLVFKWQSSEVVDAPGYKP